MSEDFGANHGILDEILRDAAADHQQPGGARLDLDVGQFAEVRHRVDRQIRLVFLHPLDLMFDEPEARRRVDEGRAEDRHVMLIGDLAEARPEERRAGEEWVSKCRSAWAPYKQKKKTLSIILALKEN